MHQQCVECILLNFDSLTIEQSRLLKCGFRVFDTILNVDESLNNFKKRKIIAYSFPEMKI